MNKFTSEFNFSEMYKDLTDFLITDPYTLRDTHSGEFYTMNNISAKKFNSYIGLKSARTSNSIYKIDIPAWNSIRDKKSVTPEAIKYLSSHKALIIDGIVVSIVNNDSYLTKFLNTIEKYLQDERLISYYYYDSAKDYFMFMTINENKNGVCIVYDLSWNWIYVYPCKYKSHNDIFISPYAITNKEVSDDIETVLDKEFMFNTFDQVDATYNEFVRKSKVTLSDYEVGYFMKSLLKIKLRYEPFDVIDECEKNDYSSQVQSVIEQLHIQIYGESGKLYLTSPYIKRCTSFSNITFSEIYTLASALLFDEKIDYTSLIEVTNKVLSNKSNYAELNGVI